MSRRVAGRRQDAHAVRDLGLALVLDVRRALELHPLRDREVRLARCHALDALHVDRGADEEPVPAAVVEVQVRVDHADDVARDLRGVEADAPLGVELRRRVDHAGVDEDAPLGMIDHVDAVRPPLVFHEHVAVLDRADVVELHGVSFLDLKGGDNGR